MTEWAAYSGLFVSAFGAATILPFPSEPVLIGLLLSGMGKPWLLVLVASIGNTLGAVVNWWLGRQIERFRDRRWFPMRPDTLERTKAWYHRAGKWSLLFSWLPVVGDPLTMVAGVLREPLPSFLLLVFVAKTCRFVAVACIALYWT